MTTERSSRGQAAVELAIVIPILLLIVLGGLELGSVFWKWQQVSAAASEGARRAIVVSQRPDRQAQVESAVLTAAPNLDAAQVDIAITGSWTVGNEVTVTASYPVTVDVFGAVVYDGTVTSSRSMRVWN